MRNQTNFQIVSLPETVSRAVRASLDDQSGKELLVVRDGQPHQCRSCLHLSKPDEGVILVSHKPFTTDQPYAETGPVFIHERSCVPYSEVHTYPPEFPHKAVVLRAYNDQEQIVGAEVVGERPVEQVIAQMFENQATAYLHARNLGYGCYMFRIDRA